MCVSEFVPSTFCRFIHNYRRFRGCIERDGKREKQRKMVGWIITFIQNNMISSIIRDFLGYYEMIVPFPLTKAVMTVSVCVRMRDKSVTASKVIFFDEGRP